MAVIFTELPTGVAWIRTWAFGAEDSADVTGTLSVLWPQIVVATPITPILSAIGVAFSQSEWGITDPTSPPYALGADKLFTLTLLRSFTGSDGNEGLLTAIASPPVAIAHP
jgi:hypothetical protein